MIARTPTGTAARLIRALLELLGPEAELFDRNGGAADPRSARTAWP